MTADDGILVIGRFSLVGFRLPPLWRRDTTYLETHMPRTLSEIAAEIRSDWKKVNYGAAPYLDAMRNLDSPSDKFGLDDGASIVARFLVNAGGWRGPVAHRVKAELRAMTR